MFQQQKQAHYFDTFTCAGSLADLMFPRTLMVHGRSALSRERYDGFVQKFSTATDLKSTDDAQPKNAGSRTTAKGSYKLLPTRLINRELM